MVQLVPQMLCCGGVSPPTHGPWRAPLFLASTSVHLILVSVSAHLFLIPSLGVLSGRFLTRPRRWIIYIRYLGTEWYGSSRVFFAEFFCREGILLVLICVSGLLSTNTHTAMSEHGHVAGASQICITIILMQELRKTKFLCQNITCKCAVSPLCVSICSCYRPGLYFSPAFSTFKFCPIIFFSSLQ